MSSSLRECYPEPSERAVLKTQRALDVHMTRFVALSPFVCLGSSSEDGADVTPRGDLRELQRRPFICSTFSHRSVVG